MSARVSFADLLKAGADKDKQRLNLKLAAPAPSPSLKPVAPEKDFNKRANSLEREALPSGLFPGASKAIYDALYLRTLGAVNPTNNIQATRKEIINWSGIKNLKTVTAHLKKLEDNGLIKRSSFKGEQSGNYYEIYLPNQSDLLDQPDPDSTQTRSRSDPTQTRPKPRPNPTRKSVWVGSGNPIENKGTYGFPNTLKTKKKNDDEPAALTTSDNEISFIADFSLSGETEFSKPMIDVSLSDAQGVIEKAISETSKKLIGKELRSSDVEKLQELAEILVMELEIAAARTDSISNVPAFLTEHLRRRLWGRSAAQNANKTLQAKQTSKKSAINKTSNSLQAAIEIYQAEPLTIQAKETVLRTMREYIGRGQREFVMSLQDTYTTDDWKWLSERL